MVIGIDASNIRLGGGVTHLKELLDNTEINNFGSEKVIVFSGSKTLDQLRDQAWLIKVTHPLINKSLVHIILWQQFILNKMLRKHHCSLLFCPAGTYIGSFKPFISMSQNMLIFEKKESARYGFSLKRIKFFILYIVQSYSLKKSNGIIFPSKYAKDFISKSIDINSIHSITISHGINNRFDNLPKAQSGINTFSFSKPYSLLYVSTLDVYKHQWNVVQAVYNLRQLGFPLELTIIGSSFKKALKKLNKTIQELDPTNSFIKYIGSVPYDSIDKYYKVADAFVLASTCESFGNILLEAMTAGLPVACSNKSAMPEILKDAGFYFEPEDIDSITHTLERMIKSPLVRDEKAKKAYEYSKQYSWEKCAVETFSFVREIAKKYYRIKELG